MPKKTKKQKIISEYRKKIHEVSSSHQDISSITPSSTINSSTAPTISLVEATAHSSRSNQKIETLVAPNEFTIIKKDLLSTLLISAIILIGEFAIARYIRF